MICNSPAFYSRISPFPIKKAGMGKTGGHQVRPTTPPTPGLLAKTPPPGGVEPPWTPKTLGGAVPPAPPSEGNKNLYFNDSKPKKNTDTQRLVYPPPRPYGCFYLVYITPNTFRPPEKRLGQDWSHGHLSTPEHLQEARPPTTQRRRTSLLTM